MTNFHKFTNTNIRKHFIKSSLILLGVVLVVSFVVLISPTTSDAAQLLSCPIQPVNRIDVSIVSDVSGSMGRDDVTAGDVEIRRDNAVRIALIGCGPPNDIPSCPAGVSPMEGFIDKFDLSSDGDHIALHTFNKNGHEILSFSTSISDIRSSIMGPSFTAGGSTNMSAGLARAKLEIIQNGRTDSDPNSPTARVVIVLGDGAVSGANVANLIENLSGHQSPRTQIWAIAFGSGISLASLQTISTQPDMAISASDLSGLSGIYSQIAETIQTPSNLDFDDDGSYPKYCEGGPACAEKPCTDYYNHPGEWGLDPEDTANDRFGNTRSWLSIFKENPIGTTNLDDLDADGVGVYRTSQALGIADGTAGNDWYDNPLDAPGSTIAQLADTLNDLDLDGYARNDSGVAPTEPAAYDRNGCINPGAYEGECTEGGCEVAAKDAVTGRVPYNISNPGAPGPVLPHPKDVCEIKAIYGCGLVPETITSGPPLDPHPSLGWPLISAKYQCEDGVDNDLDNVLEGTNEGNEPGCFDNDIDGDGLISATHFSCIPETTCDYYDDPRSFGMDTCGEVLDPNGATRKWLEIFKNTADNDLDKDGNEVAIGRLLGNRADELRFLKDPSSAWKDWYDNPFTADLSSLTVKPTLRQLGNTINDLDLDTFAAQSWAGFFNEDVPSEPDEADITIVNGKNRAGCAFPGALEETCSDCTAYVPDSGTGRIPYHKIRASFDPKKVCQIEAYYKDIGMKTVFPGADADIGADVAPSTHSGKNLLSVTAQCQDEVDNDLDSIVDGDELECPKAGGIVPCGRYSDNPLTAVDESQPCGFCHFFYLFDNVTNWIIWRIVPALAILLLVIGGLAVATSRGNASQLTRGRDIIIWTFIGYAIILVGWTVLNSFFGGIGVKKWTGMAGEGGGFESINAQRIEVQDTDAEWPTDEWAGFLITISHPDWNNAEERRITSNRNQYIVVDTALPAGTADEMTYKIGGWWQFSCR